MRRVVVLLSVALLSCVTEASDSPLFVVVGGGGYPSATPAPGMGHLPNNSAGAESGSLAPGQGCPSYDDLGVPCNSTARCRGTIGECHFWMCPPGCTMQFTNASTFFDVRQNSEYVCSGGVWIEEAVPLTCPNPPICSCPPQAQPIAMPMIGDAAVQDASVEDATTTNGG
jgi:hypothetical protein